MKIKEIIAALERFAPLPLQDGFDNAGLQTGVTEAHATGALLCLNVTEDVVDEAASLGYNLIVAHHPLLFHGLKSITGSSYIERCVMKAIKNDITIYAAHTNLDIAAGGVNDVLAAAISLQDCRGLEMVDPAQEAWLGRIGKLSAPTDAVSFAKAVKAALNAVSVKFVDGGRPIQTVALCSGSGADCLDAAISAGADALLTSEVKQHEYLAATAAGISIFDAGHFDTEDIVIEPLRDYLAKEIPDVHFFTTHRSAIQAI